VDERAALVAQWAGLSAGEQALLADGLTVAQADKMIENVIGRYSLPLAVAPNFRINELDYLIPVVVEEPSVVAALSFAAKLAREGGGFRTGSTAAVMIAQIPPPQPPFWPIERTYCNWPIPARASPRAAAGRSISKCVTCQRRPLTPCSSSICSLTYAMPWAPTPSTPPPRPSPRRWNGFPAGGRCCAS
jgi:hypothetical protein